MTNSFVRFAIYTSILTALQGRPIDESQRVVLHGSLSRQAQAAQDLGQADPSLQIPFVTLTMKPTAAQQSELESLLARQADRSSPDYHRWLTPEQFGDRFGLSTADYQTVVEWLGSHHLRVEQAARARNFVTVSGAARDMEAAFQTTIHRYRIGGREHFANSTEVSLPAALSDLVSGIRGLDDLERLARAPLPDYTLSSGATELAPDDWATIYDVAPLYAMGINGSGQRVGILGRSDMNQAYIDQFRSKFGLPPTTVEQHLIGTDPGITNAASEAALDLEWAGAIARGATLVYIYAGTFPDAAQGAIDQNLATVLNESLSACEPLSGAGTRLMAQQANAQGITWVTSSGDSGAAGCDAHGFFNVTNNATIVSDGPAVGMPASFPEVTAVGGTEFSEAGGHYWNSSNGSNGGSAISYIPEVVWNDTGAGGLLASGGGASIYFQKPAWQAGPGVPNDNFRDVPDISFSASGNHDPYMAINANGQIGSGGTSASSPSFAGVVALLNQYLVNQGALSTPGLGNVNPTLYRLARTTTNVFHDITQGNNTVPCTAGSPGCVNGALGFAAGPGYDLASGLGSIDIYQLVTQWSEPAANTSITLTPSSPSIAFGASVQLTAAVTPAAGGSAIPTGTVTFTTGQTILGVAPLIDANGAALATLTVTGPVLPAGNTTVNAAYSGDSTFNSSTGSTSIAVSSAPPGSYVTVNITPNPVHEGQFITVTLTEETGVATTITGWTINGNNDFQLFAQDFRGTTLPAYGTLTATITSATPALIPSPRVYQFTGMDADGRTWSQTYTLILEGPLQNPGMTLTSAPSSVQQNPAADTGCQWSQKLLVQENRGFTVQLTRLLAGGADWTSRIPELFGTTQLAPLGLLQASVCWPGPTAPATTTFEIDGTDQTGQPVTSTVQATYTGPAANPSSLATAQNNVILNVAAAPAVATANVAVNLTGSSTWSASVLPANQSTAWLTATVDPDAASPQVMLSASAMGLSPGVYNATLLIQAPDAVPQFVELEVVFQVGATSAIIIDGVGNGASFQLAFAPGMVLSVFGSQLASSTNVASGLPLPTSMSGTSATVNGIPAPFYYASPTQLNIQIPYGTGSGPAVLGVNNGGQVGSWLFPVTASAPGIFTDEHSALVPNASGKPGDTLLAFITGDGQVSPPLVTGATPFSGTPVPLLPAPLQPVSLIVGGVMAPLTFVGVPPGLAGVTQINFVIPIGAPAGVQPVVVTVGGVVSPAASITVTLQ